jgi:hypothetical protein
VALDRPSVHDEAGADGNGLCLRSGGRR